MVALLLSGKFDNKITQYVINSYPCWSVFVKTHMNPTTQEELKFAKYQEHERKDVERVIGVLVSKFGVLERKLHGWYLREIKDIVDCCIILHNMAREIRNVSFNFTQMADSKEDKVDFDTPVESIFMETGNQVGEETENILAAQVAHLSTIIENSVKHVELMEDLTEMIGRL